MIELESMKPFPEPIDLKRLKVYPLEARRSLSRLDDILVSPDAPPPACTDRQAEAIGLCAAALKQAKARKAAIMFIYGAHLVKNGAGALLGRLMADGWITHLATNGAGSIHDWEFAFQNWSTESVEENVATGTFGTWEETGRCLHLALLAGGLHEEGYGVSLGRFIHEDGVTLPTSESLEDALRREPAHPLSPARA